MKRTIFRLRSKSDALRLVIISSPLIALAGVGTVFGGQKFLPAAEAQPAGHPSPITRSHKQSSEEKNPDQTELKGSWTPPAKDYSEAEISRMPAVVLLRAGETLSLSISPTAPILKPPLSSGPGVNPHFRPGGRWRADYGQITSHGIFTAPRFVPSEGSVTIDYDFPGHPNWPGLQAKVHIVANPAIPGSGSTPYLYMAESPAGDGELIQTISWKPAIPAGITAPVSDEVLKKGPIAVLSAGDVIDAPVEITRIRPLPSKTKNGLITYTLPATNSSDSATSALLVKRPASLPPLCQARELLQLPGDSVSDPYPFN